MPAQPSLVGQRFSRWFVFSDAPPIFYGVTKRMASWVRCDCGREKIIANSNLERGLSKSCLHCRRCRLRHGHSCKGKQSRIYQVWAGMIQRCTNPNHIGFNDYGERGIMVCERWCSFDAFLEDMGPGKKGWTIERVNNNGNYELSNCVWGTHYKQSRNSRHNKILTIRGRTGCLSELCEYFDVSYSMVKFRLKKGMETDLAFFKRCRYSVGSYGKWDPSYNGKTPQYSL